jgi:hypothetical protein
VSTRHSTALSRERSADAPNGARHGRTSADSIAWNFAWVSASSASGSLSATMPPPATSRAEQPSSEISAHRIATAQVPFPFASSQPTAPPYRPR